MKLLELLQQLLDHVTIVRHSPLIQGLGSPISAVTGRLVSTVGALYLYELTLPSGLSTDHIPFEDMPVTILPPDGTEPTEGFVMTSREETVMVQTFDSLGKMVASATIITDAEGFFDTVIKRLSDVIHRSETYSLGPAERLLPWLTRDQSESAPETRTSSAVLSTLWGDDLTARRTKVAVTVAELVRGNKRVLVVCPDHRSADELSGMIARTLRAAGLTFKSLLSRYEMAAETQAAGIPLSDLGFEAQMHQFYAKSRAEKATLRKKYERFRELTPLLAYKAEKQRDLDEVKLLEWRLLTQISDLQAKIKEIDTTLAEYQAIPIWKRLALQTVGKNVESLAEYRTIYDSTIQGIMTELETAQQRIAELKPEAAIPKELRPEYQELKEDVTRLGGTKKIRELLAAEEGTNRQAFIQNKRIIVTTAARIVSDPLFSKVRFDVMLADEAPFIPAPYLLAAAVLIREKIILSGNTQDIPSPDAWASPLARPRQAVSPQPSAISS
jgi:hypothetical protein